MRPSIWITLALAGLMTACVSPTTRQKPVKVGVAATTASASPKAPSSPSPKASPSASPSPSPEAPQNYFPLSKGARWVYRMTTDGREFGTFTQQVETVESADGVVTATIAVTRKMEDNDGQMRTTRRVLAYRKDAREVNYVEEDADPVIEFKFPLEVGTTWPFSNLEVRVMGTETIDVPYKAGLVAMKVGTESSLGQLANWYVDGIGFVKTEFPSSLRHTIRHELIEHSVVPSNPVY